jgi:hypothetical protein
MRGSRFSDFLRRPFSDSSSRAQLRYAMQQTDISPSAQRN